MQDVESLRVSPAILAKYGQTVNAGDFVRGLLQSVLPERHEMFEKRWLELFPESAADVASYKANPECTCKHKLTSLLLDSPDKAMVLIREFHPNPMMVTGLMRDGFDRAKKTVSASTDLSGQTMTIDATPEAWAATAKHLRDIDASFTHAIATIEAGKLHIFFL